MNFKENDLFQENEQNEEISMKSIKLSKMNRFQGMTDFC